MRGVEEGEGKGVVFGDMMRILIEIPAVGEGERKSIDDENKRMWERRIWDRRIREENERRRGDSWRCGLW